MTVLAVLQPLDPATGDRVILRVASAADRDAAGWNDERWFPAIRKAPALAVKLFEAEFDGRAAAGADKMELATEVLKLAEPNQGRLVWAGAPVALYRYSGGAATLLFRGRVGNFSMDGKALSISLLVDDEPFRASVLASSYAGTGGAEGAADLKGRVKPWLFGRAVNVEPVLINATLSIYQLSAYGAVSAISGCFERGASFGAATANYATYAALAAATLAPGQWATCLAQGLLRLGAPAAGVITVDADGDAVSGFVRKTGAILTRIATALGVDGEIASGTMAALDTAVPFNIALYLTEQTTLIELAQRLAAPCNASAGVNLLGMLFVARMDFASSVLTLETGGLRMPPVAFVGEEPVPAPYKRVVLGAAPTWRVHGFDEIAFTAALSERGLYDSATVYYEGNIATTTDGSRWLYIATTGQAGVTPGSDGAVWSVLSPADATRIASFYQDADPAGPAKAGDLWVRPSDSPKVTRRRNASDTGWDIIANLATEGSHVGVENGATSNRDSIYDPFDYTTVADFDAAWTGGAGGGARNGEVSLVSSNDTPGGVCVDVGNNAGDDYSVFLSNRAMPYDPEDLYEVSFDLEGRASHSLATFFLGLACYNAAGVRLDTSAGTYAYVAAYNVPQNNAARTTYRGYVRGRASSGTGGVSNDRAAPSPLPTGTASIRLAMLLSYSNASGIARLHQAGLKKISDVQVPTDAWVSTRSYFRDETVVSAEGRSFGSKIDGNLNHQPPTTFVSDAYWYRISDKGADGVDGDDGADAPLIKLDATQKYAKYNKDNAYAGGSITFTTTRQNIPSGTTWGWRLYRMDNGTVVAADTAAGLAAAAPSYFSTTGASNLTVSALFVENYVNAYGGFRVEAYADGYTATDSIPIQKVKDGDTGSGAFSLVVVGNVEITTPNSVKKLSSAGWNGKFRTGEAYAKGASISGVIQADTGIGLTTDPNAAGGSYDTVDYWLFLNGSSGDLYKYQDGTATLITTGLTPGKRATVESNGDTISYYYDGVFHHSHAANSSTETLYGVGVMYPLNSVISEIAFSSAGTNGQNGLSVAEVQVFKRAASAPSTPSGGSYDFATKTLTPPSGWGVVPPAGTDPLYSAKGTASVQGTTGTATPTWLGVGKIAQDGGVGADGNGVDVIFKRSASQPGTPSASSGTPSGWYSDVNSVPASSDPLWSSFGQRPNASSNYTWDTPARIEGQNGLDSLIVSLSPAAFVVPAFSSGAAKPSWTGGTCRIRLNKGGAEITSGVTYGYTGLTNISGPSMSGQDFSFADATDTKGEVTLYATYAGQTYSQKMTVTRVKDGEPAFRASAQITALGDTIASSTTPNSRPGTVSASVTYYHTTLAARTSQVTMSLYWRNATDGGGWNLLGTVTGTVARMQNFGTVGEPDWQMTPGSVSGSWGFTTPGPPDKLVEYRANLSNSGSALDVIGGGIVLGIS